jgi:TRAP-type mannitol/chloroaromatic compound transport system permease large subunit
VAPPEITIGHIFRAVIPYIAMSLLVLALVFFVPAVAVWLPKVLV